MSDGHRSGRSAGRVSCKSTELKRCSMIEMRWNKYEVSLTSPVISIIIILTPVLNTQGMKKLRCAIQKVQKSSWNEPYSSSSFTKQPCSRMAVYRWIKTESRWNKKLICLSSPDWSATLRPSLERKTRSDALIGPNDSTATGWKIWWPWMFEYFAVLLLLLLL